MAAEPWFAIYPAAGALVFAALARGLYKKRASLGGAENDWIWAFLLCAGGWLGVLGAHLSGWDRSSDIAAAAAGTGATMGLIAAFAGLLQRYTRGRFGAAPVRRALQVAGLALVSLSFGAAMAASGTGGDGFAAPWSFIPVTAAAAGLVFVAVQAARKGMERAGAASTVQLQLGGVLVAGGFVMAALADVFVGSFIGITGGAILYSGVLAAASRAPAARTPIVTPKVEAEEPRRSPNASSGRKVRVPKGEAMKVSSFRDDEPGRGSPP